MLVSVIIPTKNRPAAVSDAVRSVVAGSHQTFELFVVDQSDDDRTYEALAPFHGDSRFHYLLNRRPGYGAASSRNMGITVSQGDVIAIIDDDVEARPDWLERIAAEFAADPALEFVSGKLTAPPFDPAEGFTPHFDAQPTITTWQFTTQAAGANFIMRRSLLERIGGYDEFCGPGSRLRASDDGDLVFRVVRSRAKWRVCPWIEVIHTHGFRPGGAAPELRWRYEYGNGGNFGRFARRGDMVALALFTARELRRIYRGLRAIARREPTLEFQSARVQLRGFVAGFRLPPHEGFVSGPELARRHREAADSGGAVSSTKLSVSGAR